jgi:3-methylornithine--L-lysine ligase
LLHALSTAGSGRTPQPAAERAVIFEHIVVSPGSLEVTGEHAVAAAGPLAYIEDFFGADEALTNYRPGRPEWLATLIMTGESRPDLHAKRAAVIDRIRSEMRIGPEGVSL